MGHPVTFEVEPPEVPRDRLTVAFRPLLAISHVILVGGPLIGILGGGYRTGLLGALALVLALFDWFAILFTGAPIAGLQPLKHLYLDWRARALAYTALLRDEYPPFGEGTYPARLVMEPAPTSRDRLTVGLRPFWSFLTRSCCSCC